MVHLKKLLFYFLPPLLWAGLIFWNSSQSDIAVPVALFPHADKLIHGGVYFILAWLVIRAFLVYFPKKTFCTATIITAGLGLVYGASDEWHQLFVPGRSCDILDWFADAAGILLAVLIFYWFQKKASKAEQ
ncbi:VanZ family protein [bacterium]|nr:VanZ family protein [bacterium]